MPLPKIALTAGLMAANMALTMTRKIEGPRLDDLKFTGGDYGAPLPMIWGMRRIQGSVFWAEPLREVKRRRKTKGGKFNEYTYYGTWAVAVAGHEIDAVSRIWFDTHLVYDATGAGPLSPFDFGGSGAVSDYIKIYTGGAAQEADERMQATVEAEQGAGSCPAYRGTAYIMFKDIPLEKLGNRIPQVSAEVIRASNGAWPSEALTVSSAYQWVTFSNDFSMMAMGGPTKFSILDTAARTEIVGSDFTPDAGDLVNSLMLTKSGKIITTNHTNSYLYEWELSGTGTAYLDIDGTAMWVAMSLLDSAEVEHKFVSTAAGSVDFYFDGAPYYGPDQIGVGFHEGMIFATSDGEVWAIGRNSGSSTAVLVFWQMVGGSRSFTVTVANAADISPFAFHYQDATNDHFVVGFGDWLYTVDRETETVLDSYSPAYPNGIEFEAFRALRADRASFWIGFEEISSVDLTSIRELDRRDWTPSSISAHTGTIYDPVNHALITGGGATMRWHFLDRVGSAGTTLGEIAADVADMAGVEDHDFTALDQVVQGWSATQGSGAAMLEPLFDAFDSDCVPHDFGLLGKKRGGTASQTLETEWFARDDGARYAVRVRQAAELPRALTYSFADVDAEQQPNNVRADRPATTMGSLDERTIDLATLASDGDEMRGLAERHFRRIWNERREASLSLTMRELALEPGDLRILELDGEQWPARCVRATIRANGAIATEWRHDFPALAQTSGAAGATFDGREPASVAVPLLTKGFVLDIPLLADVHDATAPQLYLAAAPFAEGVWPGAVFWQAVDGEYTEELAGVSSTDAATWGYATDALGEPVSPWLWDRGNSVNVALQVGTLTGTTEAVIDGAPRTNMALLGQPGRWEVLNFTTATLEGDGSYTLSGLKRGRRGTEWACADHAVGDLFLLLDTAATEAMGLSEVGTNLSFKAITAGRTSGLPLDLEPFTGATLKPYAPTALQAAKDAGTGDWSLSWVRRTRVGGAWTSGTTIPLSEDSEEYEVDIMNGSTVVRTIAGLSTPAATYTAAQQTTDFGGSVAVGALSFRVYQISAQVDRGFAAEGAG